MKTLLLLTSAICLSACSAMDPKIPPQVFPLQVTQLSPATDKASGKTDVSVAVRNTDGYTLRSALITVVGYDAHGNVTGPLQTLQIDGPLPSESNSGQVLKKDIWRDADIRCVDIVAVKITAMDYATDHVDGLLAKATLKNRDISRCTK